MLQSCMSIGGANFEEHLIVAGDISSSGQLTLEKNIVMQSPQQIRLNSVATDDKFLCISWWY